MENFDDLSNDQLRLKMLEYGMPNMPITATTRKLVVKKLKNYVETANSKTRRDTIHVTKFSSDEDTDTAEEPKKAQKKETSRRATIGGSAAKLSKTLPVMPDLPPPKAKSEKAEPVQKRRSGRITPVQGKDDAPTLAAPKEPMIVENSDDDEDEDMIPLTQPVNRRERKSKSPSLSRADMVTTSYIHQVEVEPRNAAVVETMEIDLTESTDDVVVEPEPVPEPRTRPQQVTPSRESRYNTTSSSVTSKRTTIAGGFSTGTPSRQPELSTSFGRPSMSTVYSSPRATETRREDVHLEPTDSPYLSEFTKRLSRLKAENAQLNAVRDHPIRRTIASSYAATRGADGDYVSSRLAQRMDGNSSSSSNKKQGEIRASIRQVILALDQKYSIRKMFYLLIVAMIVIFLFVFFFL